MDDDLGRCLGQVQRLNEASEMIAGFVHMYTKAIHAAARGRHDLESIIREKGERVFTKAADIAFEAAEHIAKELGPLDHSQ
jgi:hypothetical protein